MLSDNFLFFARRLDKPLEAVQMDELYGKTVKRKDKTEFVKVPNMTALNLLKIFIEVGR